MQAVSVVWILTTYASVSSAPSLNGLAIVGVGSVSVSAFGMSASFGMSAFVMTDRLVDSDGVLGLTDLIGFLRSDGVGLRMPEAPIRSNSSPMRLQAEAYQGGDSRIEYVQMREKDREGKAKAKESLEEERNASANRVQNRSIECRNECCEGCLASFMMGSLQDCRPSSASGSKPIMLSTNGTVAGYRLVGMSSISPKVP